MWQIFGEDAVFGRGVGCCTKPNYGVGQQRMDIKEHHRATNDLDRITDKHDPPLGHRVGKGANKGSQSNVGDGKKRF